MSRSKYRPNPSSSFLTLPLVSKTASQFFIDVQRCSRNSRSVTQIAPCLAGRSVDLLKLYNAVACRGGHKLVTLRHQWHDVYCSLGLPLGCTDAGHGMRTIYQRYLEAYERNQWMSVKNAAYSSSADFDTPMDVESQDSDVFSKHSLGSAIDDYPNINILPNHLRQKWNLSLDLLDKVEYCSLERALQSSLPNELHFALNSMLLMSSQPHGFSFHHNERLLALLLETVGISGNAMGANYSCFSHFWDSMIHDRYGRRFLDPNILDTSVPHSRFTAPHFSLFAHLNHPHDLSHGDDEGFRVLLVATILRNVSVDGGLSSILIGRTTQAIRFLFLCIHSHHSTLRHLGLETLTSLRFPVVGALIPTLKRLIPRLSTSVDRNDRIRALQLLCSLCETSAPICRSSTIPQESPNRDRNRCNVSITFRNSQFLIDLPLTTFSTLVSSLCIPDLHMVVLALDAIYNLSCLGTLLCDRIIQATCSTLSAEHIACPGIISLLFSLLRFEAQCLGSDSLVRVRVMQAVIPCTNDRNKQLQASDDPCGGTSSAVTTSGMVINIHPSTMHSVNNPSILGESSIHNPSLTLLSSRSSPRLYGDNSLIPLTQSSMTVQLPSSATAKSKTSVLSDRMASGSVFCSRPMENVGTQGSVSAQQSTNIKSIPVSSCTIRVPLPVTSTQLKLKPKPVDPPSSSARLLPKNVHAKSNVSRLNNHPDLSSTRVSESIAVSTCWSSSLQQRLQTKSSPSVPITAHICFLADWLRRNFISHQQSSVPHVKLYAAYLQAHQSKFGVHGGSPLSASDFRIQLKSVFPAVEHVKVQTSRGTAEMHYKNLQSTTPMIPSGTERGASDAAAIQMVTSNTNTTLTRTKTINHLCDLKPKLNKRNPIPTCGEFTAPAKIARQEHRAITPSLPISKINGIVNSTKSTLEAGAFPTTTMTNGSPLQSLIAAESINPLSAAAIVPNSLKQVNNAVSLSTEGAGGLILLPLFRFKSSVQSQPVPNFALSLCPVRAIRLPTVPKIVSPTPTSLGIDQTVVINGVDHSNVVTKPLKLDSNKQVPIEQNGALPFAIPASLKLDNHQTISDEPPRAGMNPTDSAICANPVRDIHFENHPNSLSDLLQTDCLFMEDSNSPIVILSSPEPDDTSDVVDESNDGADVQDEKADQTLHSPAVHEPSNEMGLSCDTSLSTQTDPRDDHPPTHQATVTNSSIANAIPITRDSLWSPPISLSADGQNALSAGPDHPSFLPSTVREGPVTKHIRLTAALALKNFLQYSPSSSHVLPVWEDVLCELAFSSSESAPTIRECLSLVHTKRINP